MKSWPGRGLSLLSLLAVVVVVPVVADSPSTSYYDRPLEITITPGASAPVGRFGPYLGFGVGGAVGFTFRPSLFPLAFGGLSRLGFYPLADGSGSIESYTAAAVIGGRIRLGSRLRVAANAAIGGTYSVLRTPSGPTGEPDFAYSVELGVGYHFSRLIFADLRLGYQGVSRLYQGFGATLGIGFALGSPSRYFSADLPDPEYDDGIVGLSGFVMPRVFPVLYKYYDDNPLGSVTVTNWGEEPITDLFITMFVNRYMDAPRVADCPEYLDAGQSAAVTMNALFTDEVLLVTADTKATAVYEVSYIIAGQERSFSFERTLDLADRNAMTWDDDRKAAAFVTQTDPVVATFARNIAGVIRNAGYEQVIENLRVGVGLFEALRLHGTYYVPDPNTPYVDLSQSPESVDYLQFPRHTLESRAGDCDDLTICYNSMLESVGVPSAFITVPGHILSAVQTGLSEEEARRRFIDFDNLIVHEGQVWVPVEVTMVQDGFGFAWEQGARLWREHEATGNAELIPVSEAWKVYEGVGLLDTGHLVPAPAGDDLIEAFEDEIGWFVRSELEPRIQTIRARIDESGENARLVNSIGAAYAQVDLLTEARREFQHALELDPDYLPSLVNLGNVLLLAGETEQALSHFLRALETDATHPGVLLSLAKTYHELEDYGQSAGHFRSLSEHHPEIADRYPYLDRDSTERTRASDLQRQQRLVEWEDEQ